jgi:dipeptidyl aminopeptidase/acylaminoacyl peptidase
MQGKRIQQYGTWSSPLQPPMLAAGIRLTDVAWDSDGLTLVWHEGRSDRGVLVWLPPNGDAPRDLTTELSVRARVGYGGGDFTVAAGQVYFVEAGGRLYRQPLQAGAATPLTPAFGHAAAPTVSPDQRFLVYVHTDENRDCLAIVDTAGQHWPQQLVSGADFYMQPCWHPHGTHLAWVSWHHPHMPWEGATLYLGTVEYHHAGLPTITDIHTIAGSDTVGVFQPLFSPDGSSLAYISNETGWDALYIYDLQQALHRALLPDHPVDVGQPAWIQGMRTYGFRHDGQALYFLPNHRGFRYLWMYDFATATASEHPHGLESYTFLEQPAFAPNRNAFACIASAPDQPSRIIMMAYDTPQPRICRRSSSESIPSEAFSTPRAISWPTDDGSDVHGLFSPPKNPQFAGSGAPPAILLMHGGPTAQAVAAFQPNVQFFTTRGLAVLQVNYRGSSGYGTAYVNALRGQWGVADVADAVSGAQYLVQQGWVDAHKLVIMGGSAGGYTVLQALITHPGFFKAGICLYGISNLFTLAATTHKFEAHYLDSLIGPLPEAATLYRERSPLFHAEHLRDPLAVFQGEDDQVVPKEQADAIVASLVQRGVPHEYHVYAGEGHGWRKTETIAHFYSAVEQFLRHYVVFA